MPKYPVLLILCSLLAVAGSPAMADTAACTRSVCVTADAGVDTMALSELVATLNALRMRQTELRHTFQSVCEPSWGQSVAWAISRGSLLGSLVTAVTKFIPRVKSSEQVVHDDTGQRVVKLIFPAAVGVTAYCAERCMYYARCTLALKVAKQLDTVNDKIALLERQLDTCYKMSHADAVDYLGEQERGVAAKQMPVFRGGVHEGKIPASDIPASGMSEEERRRAEEAFAERCLLT